MGRRKPPEPLAAEAVDPIPHALPPNPEDGPPPTKGGGKSWRAVLSGTVDVDVDAVYAYVQEVLSPGSLATAGAMVVELNRIAHAHSESKRLAVRARRDYELAKEEHEIWLEAKRTSALQVLEAEKAEGKFKKQITERMVVDAVRAAWPDEFAEAKQRLADFQAATHHIESFAESLNIRARALGNIKDLMVATGAIGREGR